MSSYRSFGGLDDQSVIDGDVGFVGMNQREQPNQLRQGEVILSQNGRIEGYWQVDAPRLVKLLFKSVKSNAK